MTVVLTGAALLLATYYLFTMYRCVFLGKAEEGGAVFADLGLRERAYLLPLVAALLIFGLYPKPLLDLVRPTVLTLLSTVK
jgi:NADH-quinone oxidoreductase subunit M